MGVTMADYSLRLTAPLAATWSEVWTASISEFVSAPVLKGPQPVSGILRFRRQQQRKKRMRNMSFVQDDRGAVLFDREHLAAQTMQDRRLQIEMIELYFKDAPASLESMRQGLAAGDAGAWEAGAHKLKNMGGTLGLMRLFELAKAANDAARLDPAAMSQAQIDALDDALCAAQAAAFAFKAQLTAQLAMECGEAEQRGRADRAPRHRAGGAAAFAQTRPTDVPRQQRW